jgi:3-methyladenine DNA glycosylase AlkD
VRPAVTLSRAGLASPRPERSARGFIVSRTNGDSGAPQTVACPEVSINEMRSNTARTSPPRSAVDVQSAIEWLERHGTRATREGMARYNIPSDRAFGVAMRDVQALAKQLGRSHALADALWASGWYEARLLAAYVDDPALVTPTQMDRWCRDFDNWGVCDTVCFALFDRTPHAWTKVETWAARRAEFVKRGAFALLWALTVHDKKSDDRPFLRGLELIEQAAADERHFVTKAVDMALRAVGKRNAALHAAAIAVARRLSASPDAAAVRIGTHALRELAKKRPRKT